MKHRIFILLITLLSSLSISAQKFVLDPLFGDSVKCSVAVKADTVWKLAEPLQHVSLEKGLEIESCGKTSNSFYVAFIIPTYPCGRYIYSLQTQLRVVGEKTSLGCNTFLHHIYHWSFDSNLGSYPYVLQVAVGNHLIHGRLHCSCSIMQATPLPWQ